MEPIGQDHLGWVHSVGPGSPSVSAKRGGSGGGREAVVEKEREREGQVVSIVVQQRRGRSNRCCNYEVSAASHSNNIE